MAKNALITATFSCARLLGLRAARVSTLLMKQQSCSCFPGLGPELLSFIDWMFLCNKQSSIFSPVNSFQFVDFCLGVPLSSLTWPRLSSDPPHFKVYEPCWFLHPPLTDPAALLKLRPQQHGEERKSLQSNQKMLLCVDECGNVCSSSAVGHKPLQTTSLLSAAHFRCVRRAHVSVFWCTGPLRSSHRYCTEVSQPAHLRQEAAAALDRWWLWHPAKAYFLQDPSKWVGEPGTQCHCWCWLQWVCLPDGKHTCCSGPCSSSARYPMLEFSL